MADDSPKKKEPTASEAMFFFAIVKHTRNKADVDWTAVADEQGFKNAEVAKVRFGQVKRKLGLTTDSSASPGSKRGASASAGATPTKVTKSGGRRVGTKGKGRGKVKKEEPVDDEEDEDIDDEEDEDIDEESGDVFQRSPPAFKIFKDEDDEDKPAALEANLETRMAPRKKTAGADGEAPTGLTDSELRFIKAVFDNMTQKPDADWSMVASDLSLKDAKCAKERFRQMSVRHGWRDSGSANNSPRKPKATDNKVAKKPRTPKKKAVKQDESSEDGVKDEEVDEDKDEKMKDDGGDDVF
ncbi:hypothetical protein HJFPF1_06479 [Paramyrothecium foliicola]|nr:hypothetical protein HJFPF1_06479 [Paramyrothecium foliicola]